MAKPDPPIEVTRAERAFDSWSLLTRMWPVLISVALLFMAERTSTHWAPVVRRVLRAIPGEEQREFERRKLRPTADVIAVGSDVPIDDLPLRIVHVLPEYPESAREAGVEGTVILHLLIDAQGNVAEVRVGRSVPMLDSAAVQAARRWKFRPALSAGSPASTWVASPVRFSLR